MHNSKKQILFFGFTCFMVAGCTTSSYVFKKPDVTLKLYESESKECFELVNNSVGRSDSYLSKGLIFPIIDRWLNAKDIPKAIKVSYANCMKSKGYMQIEVSNKESEKYLTFLEKIK